VPGAASGAVRRRITVRRRRLRLTGSAAVAGLAVGAALVSGLAGVVPASAAAVASGHVVRDGSVYDWSQLGKDAAHTSTATNSGITASDARRLGVRWSVNLHAAALSSPTVDYRGKDGMVVYAGNVNGDFTAYSLASGTMLWGRALGSQIDATPVGADGAVWVETQNPPRLYKLNPVTGKTECSLPANGYLDASLTSATPPHGVPTVYAGAMDAASKSGPIFAVRASNCHVEWRFTQYRTSGTGPWAPISYGVDAKGRGLVFGGTADPDSTEYAIDARTGREVWKFRTSPAGDYDVGSGVTVSRPGADGYRDGVAYLPGKYGVLYARDLTTGAPLWHYDFGLPPRTKDATQTGRSTAALSGSDLVFGHLGGVVELDVKTHKKVWSYRDPSRTEVISSVAIAGPSGRQVVICADLSGAIHVLDLATGHDLYNYRTGGYIVPSPAVSGNDVLISSADGFLYDLAVGGGNDKRLPTVRISYPTGGTVRNPGGDLDIRGSATDPRGVTKVGVAVQQAGGGEYWDAGTRSWTAWPVDNPASLSHPGRTSTGYTAAFPVPSYGGAYTVTATAWSRSGQPGVHTREVTFRVPQRTRGPRITLSSAYVARGGRLEVTGAGFTPHRAVSLYLSGHRKATVTASSGGRFHATITVAAGDTFGDSFVLASGHKQAASAPLTVADSWVGAAAGPRHPGYEADDTAYAELYYIGSGTGMGLGWELSTGSPVVTGPAMAHEVTYVGTSGGKLVAAHSHTGAVWWTWTAPGGSAIAGSPAVDPATRQVFVTTADGWVYALTTSGHRIWRARAPATPGSPEVAAGRVLVTSSDGTVSAFKESSGALSWRQPLTGPLSDPTADVASGRVFVGESDGSVAALSLADGSPVRSWTGTVTGAVRDAPTLAMGRVYVTTTSGSLVALRESDGSQLWTYGAGRAITGAPVVTVETPDAPAGIYLGSGGDMVALTPSGQLQWSTPLDCTPVGLAAVDDAIFATCRDGVVSAVRPWDEIGWQYKTGGAISTAPAIADAALTVGNADGDLYAFTPYGKPPG
jgi:outer membrane protein assembly factor BamB